MINGNKRSLCLSALVALIAVVPSCGFEKVTPAENVTVAPVPVNEQLGLSLSSQNESVIYQGSLLVWKPQTTRDDVQAILDATRAYNGAYAARVQAVEDFVTESLGPVDKKISALEAQGGASSGGDSALKDRADQLFASRDWFETELKTAGERYAATVDDAQSAAVFGRYCDAKVWELAIKPLLADGSFKVRPTPSAVCEKYYEQRGYFADDVCMPPETGQSKNYYPCVWTNLKKTSFVQEGPLNAAQHGKVLDAVASSRAFQTWFAGGESPCGSLLKSNGFLFFKFSPALQCTVPETALNLDLNPKTSPTENAALKTAPPYYVIRALDQARPTEELTFVAPAAGAPTEKVEAAGNAAAALAAQLSDLGADSKITCGSEQFSLTDLSFNIPFGSFNAVKAQIDSCRAEVSKAQKEFSEIFGAGANFTFGAGDLASEILRLQEERQSLVRGACDLSCLNPVSPLSQTRCKYLAAKESQAAVADARAIVIPRFSLSLTPRSSAGSTPSAWVEATIDLGGSGFAAQGCFADYLTGVSIPCPAAEGQTMAPNVIAAETMTVTFVPATQKISIAVPMTEKLLKTVGQEEKLSAQKDLMMSIDFYANAFDGKMNYISGAAAFRAGNEIRSRGVGSYLVEYTPRVAQEAKLCENIYRP